MRLLPIPITAHKITIPRILDSFRSMRHHAMMAIHQRIFANFHPYLSAIYPQSPHKIMVTTSYIPKDSHPKSDISALSWIR